MGLIFRLTEERGFTLRPLHAKQILLLTGSSAEPTRRGRGTFQKETEARSLLLPFPVPPALPPFFLNSLLVTMLAQVAEKQMNSLHQAQELASTLLSPIREDLLLIYCTLLNNYHIPGPLNFWVKQKC